MNKIKDNLIKLNFEQKIINAILFSGITLSLIQFIYNRGETVDPFDNVPGVFMEYGATAPFSVEQCANTIFWVGQDKSGANVVWMAEGYNPSRISTEAIEYYLSLYDTTQINSYSYQENGHYFYILNVKGAPTSIVYDISQKSWHERAAWNSASGQWERDRANSHVFMFGKHLVADLEDGRIYQQSLSFNDDDGTLIRRTRTFPYFTDDLEYLYFD